MGITSFPVLYFTRNINAQTKSHPKASKEIRKKIVAAIQDHSGGLISKEELLAAKNWF